MRDLHDAMMRIIQNDAVEALITEVVTKKATEQGVTLSEKELRLVVRLVRQGDDGGVRLRRWQFWDRKRITIEMTAQDASEFERKCDLFLTEGLEKLIASLVENSAEAFLSTMTKHWRKQRRSEGREIASFRMRLAKNWGEPLDKLRMLRSACLEFGSMTNHERRVAEIDRPKLVEALTRLHARSCQVSAEIICLLECGFADGAAARWRTAHEIAVVALFLSRHGEAAAERYLLHDTMESAKGAREYKRFQERLGLEPITDAELASAEDAARALIARFGRAFGETYGWASPETNKPKPSFADIEASLGMDQMRPYYRMASHNVHANPKGVFVKLGLLPESDLILAGPSDGGLATPGHGAAISLVQVTMALAMLDDSIDHAVFTRAMEHLEEQIGVQFFELEERLEELETERHGGE